MDYFTTIKEKIDRGELLTIKELNDYWNHLSCIVRCDCGFMVLDSERHWNNYKKKYVCIVCINKQEHTPSPFSEENQDE
jgi:hypothetical protein